MFWNKKKKSKKKDEKSDKPSREDLIAQAKANAAAAREEIGDETLDKIREAMLARENNPLEQAKAKIKAMDKQKVADSMKVMLQEKD